MLERKIYKDLINWKNTNNKKGLIVQGARQIGKTFIIREFGNKEYKSFIELNFLENESLCSIFDEALDYKTIITGILLNVDNSKIMENNTLLFLDEIQKCPNAITAIKFLVQEKKIDVIVSGSALGVAYNDVHSFPVGSISYLDMYSLSFEEFLWANGIDSSIIETVKQYFTSKTKVPLAIHNKMMQLLKQYMIVGGMPDIVNTFIKTRDLKEVDRLQKALYRDYISDIAHYADPNIKIKAEKCYKTIPSQLIKENHKFQYKLIESKGTARKFESSVDWLINAGIVIPIYNVSTITYPLKLFKKEHNFRLFVNDIGLLIGTYDTSLKQALLEDKNIEESSQNIILRMSKGGLYEALATDILAKNNHKDLYFYRNEDGSLEIEFLIENMDGILPIEIKSGKTSAKSIKRILQDDNIVFGYKCSNQNIGISEKLITLPLYMLMFI